MTVMSDHHQHHHGTGVAEPPSADEERAQQLSMQCWKQGLRAASEEDWRNAVEQGRQAVELYPAAPEPRFNLAVARLGLAATTGEPGARAEAAQTFDEARSHVDPHALVQYAATAVSLLEKREAQLGREPAYQYAIGTHLSVLGKAVRARRALEAAAGEAALKEL